MALETVFLVVLVVALALGNALLSFVGRNENKGVSTQQGFITAAIPLEAVRLQQLDTAVKVLSNKVDMAHSRISSLEGAVKKSRPVDFHKSVAEKLHRFDNFRANTEVELKGLREALVGLKEKHLTFKSKKLRRESKALSSEQMHKIIYRSSKKTKGKQLSSARISKKKTKYSK